MDRRLQMLSYSSLLELHRCPRSFQLSKLQSVANDTDTDGTQSITFAFGHAVGTGIQYLLEGTSIDEAIFKTLLNWPCDPLDVDEKRKKSVWHAIVALQTFSRYMTEGILRDYELVYYQEKPATEFSFYVHLPNGFKYRGFVDAVLRHRITGKILVLENKTTWFNEVHSSTYKNSSQAIGYSIVLDKIFPEISSYDVLYLIYKSTACEFEPMMFQKSYLARAQWLQEILFDTQDIARYEETGVYPMRGENCRAFNRDCSYFGTCTLNTKFLVKDITPEKEAQLAAEEGNAMAVITFEELIESQIKKVMT